MNDNNLFFKESAFCKSFIKCVNENYNLIIKINMFENKDLDNMIFYSLIEKLSKTSSYLLDFEDNVFPSDFPESEYFNGVIEKSKSLSNIAFNVLHNNASMETLFYIMSHYGDDDGKWLALYSLYLK